MLPIQINQKKLRKFAKNNTIALYLFIAVFLVAVYTIIFMYLESIYIPLQATHIKPDFVLKERMTVALIGSEKQVHKFKDDYGAAP